MFATKTIAAGIIALSALAAVPASASSLTVEFGGPGWGYGSGPGWDHNRDRHGGYDRPRRHDSRVSADQVRWMLRDSGFRAIRILNDRGPVYQVSARKQGRSFFIVVSARDGDILSVRPVL